MYLQNYHFLHSTGLNISCDAFHDFYQNFHITFTRCPYFHFFPSTPKKKTSRARDHATSISFFHQSFFFRGEGDCGLDVFVDVLDVRSGDFAVPAATDERGPLKYTNTPPKISNDARTCFQLHGLLNNRTERRTEQNFRTDSVRFTVSGE